MLKKLFATDGDVTSLILRLILGIVFVPHGMQKILGFAGTMDFFTVNLGIPVVFAFLAIMAEFLGSWGLIAGLLTRVAAFGITVNMIVAVYLLHWQHGFFMNWYGNQKGEGFEYHLLVIAIGIALMIRGGGEWSLDGLIAKKLEQRRG